MDLQRLIEPYLENAPPDALVAADWPKLYASLAAYLDLLLRWNARMNLTALRDPQEIVRRHFGEALFAGLHLGPCTTLLDLGSGAGIPGIPIQLLRRDLPVTLAESQRKKAAFLQEAVRVLGLPTTVHAGRAATLPPGTRFHTVTLRAVDGMDQALAEAASLASTQLLLLTTTPTHATSAGIASASCKGTPPASAAVVSNVAAPPAMAAIMRLPIPPGFYEAERIPVPDRTRAILLRLRRDS